MPDFRIVIDLPDLGPGDADDIFENVCDQVAGDLSLDELEGSDITARLSQKVGEQFFGRERGDDVIES